MSSDYGLTSSLNFTSLHICYSCMCKRRNIEEMAGTIWGIPGEIMADSGAKKAV